MYCYFASNLAIPIILWHFLLVGSFRDLSKNEVTIIFERIGTFKAVWIHDSTVVSAAVVRGTVVRGSVPTVGTVRKIVIAEPVVTVEAIMTEQAHPIVCNISKTSVGT